MTQQNEIPEGCLAFDLEKALTTKNRGAVVSEACKRCDGTRKCYQVIDYDDDGFEIKDEWECLDCIEVPL